MHKTNDPTHLVFVCFPGGGWASLFTSRVGLLRGGWASLLVQILAVPLAPGVDLPLQYGVRFLLLVTVALLALGRCWAWRLGVGVPLSFEWPFLFLFRVGVLRSFWHTWEVWNWPSFFG